MTDNPKTWSEMTPEEKGALLLARYECKVIEYWHCHDGTWLAADWNFHNAFNDANAYRVKPEPKRETVRIYGRVCPNGWWVFGTSCKSDTHLITFDTLDGKPDFASIRMEKIS